MRATPCRLAVLVVAVLAAAPPIAIAEEPLQITVGQPNIWSLEQAHYLLAQMHERTAKLNAKLPGEDVFDPAGLQASRFELLRTALAADLSYDETVAIGNELALERYDYESARRQELHARLDATRARQAALTTEIAELESDRTKLAATLPGSPELAALDGTIASKKAEKTAVDGQVTALTTELATALANPTLESSAPGTTATLPTHALAKFLSQLELPKPTLHPSAVLDNFVQFQYEIIAKQLSLLRDELGPGERLVFLELPQAVYTVPGRADDYLVRVSWQVESFCTDPCAPEVHCKPSWCDRADSEGAERVAQCRAQGSGRERRRAQVASRGADTADHRPQEGEADQSAFLGNSRPPSINQLLDHCAPFLETQPPKTHDSPSRTEGPRTAKTYYQQARALDLIPRTLAVSLDATTASAKSADLGLNVGTLAGLGLGVAYQRQQDLADRLVEQQVFASSYGRGRSDFGWIFAPPPGSRSLHPGDKTTYAVLALPEDAIMVRLAAQPCFFHRSQLPGEPFGEENGLLARWWRHCDEEVKFDLRVPGQSMDQWFVERIAFSSVAPGERVTVLLSGSGFSPQTGVMINGTPLRQSLSLIDQDAAPAKAPAQPSGSFEIVGSDSIALNFSMPDGYVGTPLITLLSPGKTDSINYFRDDMWINGDEDVSLAAYSEGRPMFRTAPRITAVRPAVEDGRIEILGSGFREGVDRLSINGREVTALRFVSSNLYEGELPSGVLTHGSWRIDYFDESTQRPEEATQPVANPFLPRVDDLQVVAIDKDAETLDLLFAAPGFKAIASVYPVDCKSCTPNVIHPTGGRHFARLKFEQAPKIVEVCGTPTYPQFGTPFCLLARLPAAAPPPPEVHVVTPTSIAVGTADQTVVLRGAHFGSVESVSFGTLTAKVLEKSDTSIQVVVPVFNTPGPVRIRLIGRAGEKELTNDADLEALFTYEPAKK